MFEYVLGLVLRHRQVVLVNSFVGSAARGESCVHQMIMGAGKTTVACPLLAVFLSDGSRLVTLAVQRPAHPVTGHPQTGAHTVA